MCTAPAQVVLQCIEYFGFGGVWVLHQQSLRRHDHAIEAVAALRCLFFDEGLLHRIKMIARSKTFECEDVSLHAAANRNDA